MGPNAFNDLMRRNRGKTFSDHSFEGYDGLKFGVLPVATFASGHTFSLNQCTKKKLNRMSSTRRFNFPEQKAKDTDCESSNCGTTLRSITTRRGNADD